MEIKETNLDGVFEIENKVFEDIRGKFVKTFHEDVFQSHGLERDFKESFYSTSKKGVLRGMHFQLPPHDHAKLVYVADGEILDVVVDIRKESPTFGQHFSTRLSSENAKSLYMGKGYAHGFLTLTDSATVIYLTTTLHQPDYDSGIRWDSFGFEWPSFTEDLIISNRDQSFSRLNLIELD
ncbi:dTDP-4-dehydrorhamnose 3,5-epimerase [Thiomicrorhabdus sp. Kp2]|uniref:dTDP-4-dehydrorhamnose 3,5-epimerase n=1 Tax=Thiomicrorhabdus sp. Kp2 TaxID=1123518 RepID=UPI0004224A0C|nr:dTDP-4-dehydrorhamnose 3,5-epimerase [Thiomicrorhabdus sp. Kp2]